VKKRDVLNLSVDFFEEFSRSPNTFWTGDVLEAMFCVYQRFRILCGRKGFQYNLHQLVYRLDQGGFTLLILVAAQHFDSLKQALLAILIALHGNFHVYLLHGPLNDCELAVPVLVKRVYPTIRVF